MVSLEVPKRIALDTTVLVNHLRPSTQPTIVSRLETRAHLATTIINVFELYHGAYKSKDTSRNLTGTKGLVSTLEILHMTEPAAERAGQVLAQLEAKGR